MITPDVVLVLPLSVDREHLISFRFITVRCLEVNVQTNMKPLLSEHPVRIKIVFLVLYNIQDVQVLGTGNMSGESTGVTFYISEKTLALSPYKSLR